MIREAKKADGTVLAELALQLWPDDSLSFHLAMGFEEANRIICFTKKL